MHQRSMEEFFFGTSTVGERGQVVIPVAARKQYGIEPGDKLLIFGYPFAECVIMAKVESLQSMLDVLVRGQSEAGSGAQVEGADETEAG